MSRLTLTNGNGWDWGLWLADGFAGFTWWDTTKSRLRVERASETVNMSMHD